jgi:light-regulated signal transduction histidine kinase (bacteriophytochrome)
MDPKGKVTGGSVIARDITERKKADAELEKYRQHLEEMVQQRTGELEAANAELESFSHSVSHDLRTPLRLMNKVAHMLLDGHGANPPAGAVDSVNMIINGTQKMEKLIESLLAFSQIVRAPIKRRRIDLQRLAREAIEELRAERIGRIVEFVIEEFPPCHVDRTLFKQVFLNLLANALKFTRPREKAQIRIGFTEIAGETVYFVRDNGVGFDMAKSDSLFLAFHRLHNPGEFEGSGVGLALVKRIIERHNGRIWGESDIDKGATFYFTLGEMPNRSTSTLCPPDSNQAIGRNSPSVTRSSPLPETQTIAEQPACGPLASSGQCAEVPIPSGSAST